MIKLKRAAVIVLLFIFTASAVGCAPTSSAPASVSPSVQPASSTVPSASGSGKSVIMKNHAFSPAELTIAKGETVTWTNEDAATHDVAGNTFKSDAMKKGDTFSYTFNETGTIDYTCTLHPGMDGKVIVA